MLNPLKARSSRLTSKAGGPLRPLLGGTADGPWDQRASELLGATTGPWTPRAPPQRAPRSPTGAALLPRLRLSPPTGAPPRQRTLGPSTTVAPHREATQPPPFRRERPGASHREASPPPPPRREQHRSPSPGHPRRSSSEEHQGGPPRRPPPRPLLGGAPAAETTGRPSAAWLLGASSGGRPRAGSQALSPGRQPGRDPSGPPPPLAPHREAHRVSSSEEAPRPLAERLHRHPLLGGSGSETPHRESPQPLPPRRERSGSPPRAADRTAPPRRGSRPAAHRGRTPGRLLGAHPGSDLTGTSAPLTEASPSWRFLGTSFWVSLQEPSPRRPPRRPPGAWVPWRATPGVAPRSLPSMPSPEQASEDRPPTGSSGKD